MSGATHQVTLTFTADEAGALRSLLRRISDQLEGAAVDAATADDLLEPMEPGETPEQYARYKEHMRNIAAACENSADWTEEKRRAAFLMFEELGVASRALQRYFDEGGVHGLAENRRVMDAARTDFVKRVRRFWPSYEGIRIPDDEATGPKEDA